MCTLLSVLSKVSSKETPDNISGELKREIKITVGLQIGLSRLLKLNNPKICSKDCNFGLKKELMLVFFQH